MTIAPGSSLGVIGESGAGKTTLAELAAGMIDPSSGRVIVDGNQRSPIGGRLARARRIQLIWQDAMGSVDPRLKVSQIIKEPLMVHGFSAHEARQRAGGLLDEVGLPAALAERRPHQLSGGEVQRVVIARSLALDPALLICDEPAASLDAQARARFADLLLRLQKERKLALIVIAHDLPLVRLMTSDLVVMYRGEIVERGRTEAVINNPAHEYTKLLLSCDPSLAIAGGEPSKFSRPAS